MTTHTLKIHPEFLDDIINGDKTFELRYDDRAYRADDVLRLDAGLAFPVARVKVTYVLSGWGLRAGYVALGIKLILKEGGASE